MVKKVARRSAGEMGDESAIEGSFAPSATCDFSSGMKKLVARQIATSLTNTQKILRTVWDNYGKRGQSGLHGKLGCLLPLELLWD